MHDYLEHAMQDNGRIELRHQMGNRWISGIYDDIGLLRMEMRRRSDIGNLFTTINAPRLMQAGNAMGAHPLADRDICLRTRLPFDFDPVRQKGMPSSELEMRAAIAARDRMVAALMSLGWPSPALALSGNGAHAIYRIRLPVTPEWTEMLRTLYIGMKVDFDVDGVEFDTTVRNPARIWRLYGTTNRKGSQSIERPHRVAQVRLPPRWQGASPRLIETLANSYARCPSPPAKLMTRTVQVSGAGDYSTLDVVAWFKAHGCFLRELSAEMSAVVCPWADEHSAVDNDHSTSTVVWSAHERCWPNFRCLHAHCEGRGIRHAMALWGDADAFCGTAWGAPP